MPAHASRSRFTEVVTPRRLVTAALLLLAVVLSVVGLQSVKDTRAASCSNGVVTKLVPCPGDTDLRQGQIGVVMAAGWEAELSLDGTPLPKDEVTVAGQTFLFTPGPGTATGALAPGRHTARVVYYQTATGDVSPQQFAWTFSTT